MRVNAWSPRRKGPFPACFRPDDAALAVWELPGGRSQGVAVEVAICGSTNFKSFGRALRTASPGPGPREAGKYMLEVEAGGGSVSGACRRVHGLADRWGGGRGSGALGEIAASALRTASCAPPELRAWGDHTEFRKGS
ncbi:hypothetical protein FOMPIDRAFT_1026628 [Fomitopsis schrenkii]|uniref:Uncharacterized protein n=1 Tax=Fomitopsis schrenkii TaxID=2126942 RepID=S8F284_FOMSC|nr:hypothetical protein FOMPIDRAFT_1026628 [Fomitopsis schrenkii]